MIAENIKYLRKQNELSQAALAKQLAIPRTTLSGYERGYAEPNIDMLLRLSETFDVSVDDLLSTDLSTTSVEELNTAGHRKLAITVDSGDRKGNIELVETTAEAGYLESFDDPEFIKELPRIRMPNMPGGVYRGFQISGDSMLPVEPGSIVICSYVEQLDEVKDGKTYVIATREGLVYKRVRRQIKRNAFTLVSDNTLYPPYEVPYEEIGELWQYYAHLSFSDGKETLEAMMDERIEDIRKKVYELSDQFEGAGD